MNCESGLYFPRTRCDAGPIPEAAQASWPAMNRRAWERTARRVLNDAVEAGLLASATPKGPVSLRFPESALEVLFPRLYPKT